MRDERIPLAPRSCTDIDLFSCQRKLAHFTEISAGSGKRRFALGSSSMA
jgi:hypothetical protein